MANIGEWQFSNSITEPPVTGQIRLNNGTQPSATLMWVHQSGATGIDASATLPTFVAGYVLRIMDKSDATKWQSYVVTGPPVAKTSYWEYPIALKGSGVAIGNGSRILFDNIGVQVSVTGRSATVSIGDESIFVSTHAVVTADSRPILAISGHVDVAGQLIIFDYVYPFTGKNYTCPGMTIRQHYATHAMAAFIAASNTTAANLIGKVSIYAFQVANSMIAYEEKERQGYTIPIAGADRNTPAPKPALDGLAAARQLGLKPEPGPSIRTIWPRKIIS